MALGADGSDRAGQVIHNPGTAPDQGLAFTGADVTIVVEESYERYCCTPLQERLSLLLLPSANTYSPTDASSDIDISRYGFIVHSVPGQAVGPLVHELRHRGRYLFVTDLTKEFYQQFGSSWGDFVDAMALES